jgi:hypothetical protein
MKKGRDRIAIVFSAIFVFFLLLPSAQYFLRLFPEKNLYGYVEKKANKPDNIMRGWFNKDLQRWWAYAYDSNIGFKTIGVRIFNEVTFRIFAEAPRLKLYSTKAHGLYSQMSIDSLNYEFINREALSKKYLEFSAKVVELQRLLARNGKYLGVVISSSKPYVHPDGLGKRFLVNTDSNIFSRAASIGRELEKHGVNVIDSGHLLRQFYKRTLIETHPYSGVHWNYYSGCIVTRDLLSDARQFIVNIPKLSCGDPVYKNPIMIDIDGLLLLNVLSNAGITRPSPYPSPTAEFFGGYKPRILIVGDSFLDQMVFSLKESRAYSRLVTSVYFHTRDVHGQAPDSPIESSHSLSEGQIQASLINDVFDSNLIVLQMVDYNVSRFGYGFVDSLLKNITDQKFNVKRSL